MNKEVEQQIEKEADWRSTNGHGGVDQITRDNFILSAKYGYELAQKEAQPLLLEIERLKGLLEKYETGNINSQ